MTSSDRITMLQFWKQLSHAVMNGVPLLCP